MDDSEMNSEFWAEWHTFEIDIGSEDTFHKMLRMAHLQDVYHLYCQGSHEL
jgi:hypothetical protein